MGLTFFSLLSRKVFAIIRWSDSLRTHDPAAKMRLLLAALRLLCLAHRVVAELGPNDDPGIYDEENKPVLEPPYGRFEGFSKRDGLYVDSWSMISLTR